MNEELSYPIGRLEPKTENSSDERTALFKTLEELPGKIRAAVEGCSESQLETPYREGGWNLRQVVHHLADSHVQAYMRFKLALTEENPFVTAYLQPAWGELADAKTAPLELSLTLLEAIHRRWGNVLKTMRHKDFARTYVLKGEVKTLDSALHLYAWHSRHHVAQIVELKRRKGWQ
jgi:uncharacterized damage-inducible protein DinB